MLQGKLAPALGADVRSEIMDAFLNMHILTVNCLCCLITMRSSEGRGDDEGLEGSCREATAPHRSPKAL